MKLPPSPDPNLIDVDGVEVGRNDRRVREDDDDDDGVNAFDACVAVAPNAAGRSDDGGGIGGGIGGGPGGSGGAPELAEAPLADALIPGEGAELFEAPMPARDGPSDDDPIPALDPMPACDGPSSGTFILDDDDDPIPALDPIPARCSSSDDDPIPALDPIPARCSPLSNAFLLDVGDPMPARGPPSVDDPTPALDPIPPRCAPSADDPIPALDPIPPLKPSCSTFPEPIPAVEVAGSSILTSDAALDCSPAFTNPIAVRADVAALPLLPLPIPLRVE